MDGVTRFINALGVDPTDVVMVGWGAGNGGLGWRRSALGSETKLALVWAPALRVTASSFVLL